MPTRRDVDGREQLWRGDRELLWPTSRDAGGEGRDESPGTRQQRWVGNKRDAKLRRHRQPPGQGQARNWDTVKVDKERGGEDKEARQEPEEESTTGESRSWGETDLDDEHALEGV